MSYMRALLVWFPLLEQSKVRYVLIQVVKILTVRFGKNLRIGVIQGKGTLN